MRVVNMETAVSQDLIKGSMLPIKTLAALVGISVTRLYDINSGKVKITQEEISKLEHIQLKLKELESQMKEW